jgi:hypothetical protein
MPNRNYKFFKKNGYILLNLFSKKQILFFRNQIINKINKKIVDKSKKVYNLKNFHNVKFDDKQNSSIFNSNDRFILLSKKILKKIFNNKLINKIMVNSWGHSQHIVKWVGNLEKNEIKNYVTGFRIVRPEKKFKRQIVTGAHIDMHVGGKICFDKNVLLTLWTPILGVSSKYTLSLAPGTHNINHPLNMYEKNKKIVSNIFLSSYAKKFKFIRPNLKYGQVILFHPNLLHGGSFNKGIYTRASLEIRMYNKRNIKFWN